MRIKRSSWAIPYGIFLILFVALPLLLIALYAFQDRSGAFTLQNFVKFFNTPEDLHTFVYSIEIALITTVLCLLFGYPAAWILANARLNRSAVTVILFILPMWINMLVRTLATVALFDFMKLPLGEGALIFNTLHKMDGSYAEAAQDLGASPATVFTKVTLPLSMPGVWSGILMVFMPTISTFAVAELLTLNKVKLFGTTIQENINNGMWNYGAALALIMLVIIAVTSTFTDEEDKRADEKGGLI